MSDTVKFPTCDTSDPAQVEASFWQKVDVQGACDCWPWMGAIQRAGYGTLKIGGKGYLAHRIAYMALIGPIPSGLFLDHLCRNRWCVNPAHLEPVTSRENTLRGETTLAARQLKRTHCPKNHPYEGANLRKYGRRRFCRECERLRIRPDKHKRRSA